jgi:hypothetical protein
MKKPRLFRKNKLRIFDYLKDLFCEWRIKSDKQLWLVLEPVILKSTSTGCDYSELWVLNRHVRKARPSAILELGSGISTVVITNAVRSLAREGHSCRFVSMEESVEYHAQLLSIFPPELLAHADILCSPVEDRAMPGGLIARTCRDKPRERYDFVFIDGPQVPKTGGYFDADILDVLAWNEGPVTAFLDQRMTTRKALLSLLPFAKVRANREFARFQIPAAQARLKQAAPGSALGEAAAGQIAEEANRA